MNCSLPFLFRDDVFQNTNGEKLSLQEAVNVFRAVTSAVKLEGLHDSTITLQLSRDTAEKRKSSGANTELFVFQSVSSTLVKSFRLSFSYNSVNCNGSPLYTESFHSGNGSLRLSNPTNSLIFTG